MMRKDILEAVAEVKDMVFPIFTNGTLIGPSYIDFLKNGPIDTLYLGAGVFLGKVNSDVIDFINTLTPKVVKEVVLFGSSAIINSPVPQMRKALEAKGIKVSNRSFTCKGSMGPIHMGHPNKTDLDDFCKFDQIIKGC
ncbi:MAG: hypothetical protein K5945_08850 [Bacteroidaceae bacterium]|nr:hypothetical protein [Bacteroidaceae bacterium]